MTDAPDYLRDAVTTKVARAAGLTIERATQVIAYTDPQSFTDDKGEIDNDKIARFAAVFTPGATSAEPPVDQVRAALERNRGDINRHGAGSITDIRERTVERLIEGSN